MNETLIDPIVEFFEWYDLNDTPIEALHFDFLNQSISLVMEDYDDQTEQVVPCTLLFKGVHKYTFDYPVERFFYEMKAIYRVKLNVIHENYYELEILIDMKRIEDGIEFTVGKMLIGFQDLEVIGGLSREAMEYKWKTEEE